MASQLQIANRNIKLYVFLRIFAKRVFLPLSAIYFIDTAGFTIRDIGLLSAFYSLIQLVVEVPTGYFADKIGRVASIRLGSLLAALSTIFYITLHTKLGIFTGTLFEALGYSFMAGAGEALIHDSLIVKKQEHEYTKILSRSQSVALIANAVLVSLVPMTYVLNSSYPFMLGTLAYVSLFIFALYMHDVKRPELQVNTSIHDFTKIIGRKSLLLFALTFGIIAALYSSPTDMLNIALKEYGIRPDYLGWIYGVSSVLGAALGPFMHYLRTIKLSNYLLIDLGILCAIYAAAFSHSATILLVIMIVAISFWRYRKIIYQSYLLGVYSTEYKATLLSTLNNLEQLNSIWIPLFITSSIAHLGTSKGFGMVGLFTCLMVPMFFMATLRFFKRAKPAAVPLVNQTPDVV